MFGSFPILVALRDLCKVALGEDVNAFIPKAFSRLHARADAHKLPPNHDLQHALQKSLSNATRALAWNLFEPNRKKFSDVLANCNPLEIVQRLDEAIQQEPKNLRPGTSDYWISALMEKSSDWKSFEEFNFGPLLLNNEFTKLVPERVDEEFSIHVHNALLQWVEKCKIENPHIHPDFEKWVRNGWTLSAADGSAGAHVTFYQIFCLFFREELKDPHSEKVFKIYVADTLAEIKQMLSTARASQIPDITFQQWQSKLDAQNQEVLSHLQEVLTVVKKIDTTTTRTDENVTEIKKSLDELLAMFSKSAMTPQRDPEQEEAARLNVLETWAKRYGLALPEAEKIIERFIADTRSDPHADSKTKADAEFLAQNFLEAAQLYKNSAREALRQLEKKEAGFQQEKLRLKETVVNDLLRAGESFYSVLKYKEALAEFEEALTHTDRKMQAELWAKTQVWIGLAASEHANRTEGLAIARYSQQSITAYRVALEVYTRAQLPQDWAMTQNNLADALSEQALRSAGENAVVLLAEAVQACRAALEVYTREQLPQDWAMTQNNLAIALKEQALRSAGENAVALLAEAVQAYRAALEVRTCKQLPQDWAMTQNNLATALQEQALRSAGEKAVELLAEAVTAYRAALEIYTRKQLPQGWAMTQNNLANALSEQALRSVGENAVALLAEAVQAYRAALEVYTRQHSPHYHQIAQNNLARACAELQKREQGNIP